MNHKHSVMQSLTGIVLAGGSSRRMGRDKAALSWQDSDLLHAVLAVLSTVCSELIVVGSTPRSLSRPGVRVVEDNYPGCGPLAGLEAGLRCAGNPYSFVAACDMPYISAQAISYIYSMAEGYDAAVPCIQGRYHPLHAVYRVSCLERAEANLQQGRYKMTDLFKDIHLYRVSAEEIETLPGGLKTLSNINTPADYAALVEAAEKI